MQELWVFGYGSLMWRPGFAFESCHPARVAGVHRSLCVYSHVHRGTPERPGLVLGLDRGGACRGLAFRVAGERRAETVAYLREREQVTMVYREEFRRVRLLDAGDEVEALTFVVDRSHPQYAGRLAAEEQARYVLQGAGRSGACRDYVAATLAHLEEAGVRDRPLRHLMALLNGAATPEPVG